MTDEDGEVWAHLITRRPPAAASVAARMRMFDRHTATASADEADARVMKVLAHAARLLARSQQAVVMQQRQIRSCQAHGQFYL